LPLMQVDDLRDTLSAWLNVPVDTLAHRWTAERLAAFERHLRERIIGQDHVIARFMSDFKTVTVLGRDAHDARPLITMLAVGPSGVGKTELARQIAEFIFGGANTHFIKIDCARYGQAHTLSA